MKGSSITKVELMNGVHWVEIPEAELNLLCGCPPDAVKHLMKRGLIRNQEVNGVTFESGPNAILLSDLSLQKGRFSNMAEFPVLQMLYRQGMIIPNHPGNTGTKPILVGAPDQIQHQMQYIFRGNYGLVTKEEILSTGIGEDEAELMMELKLKFAFGAIRHPGNLIDTRDVREEPVEVINGVMVERVALNQFIIRYDGDEVEVNLNLEGAKDYPLPYALHHHDIPREYFSILHSGDGDGWDINRPSMSSILMHQGKVYLIDAGPNIGHILNHLGIGINEIHGIFHTHSHDDHFAGLTTLLLADRPIRYYTTPLVRECVTRKLMALLSVGREEFSRYFEPIDLEMGAWNDIEGLDVRPIFSPHPVETCIFEFRALWEDGYVSYSHLADITARDVLDGFTKNASLVDDSYVEQVYGHYLTPHDIKKIDIGGGMIHGVAEDFREDESEKIILAHTALPLNTGQKEIGSGAPFGTVDTLIRGRENILYSQALQYLASYYPEAPHHSINLLLNFPLITFNPETIILKANETHDHIYLVLTGNVEVIRSDTLHSNNVVSAGALLGEFTGMIGIALDETYRSMSFVNALKIPGKLYHDFVKRIGLYKDIEALSDNRWYLHRTWLMGESISTSTLNRIAKAMEAIALEEGPLDLMISQHDLIMVEDAEVELHCGEGSFRICDEGSFFGEELSFFQSPPLLDARVIKKGRAYRIPHTALADIPIVRFKLHEAFERKVSFLLNTGWSRQQLNQLGSDGIQHHLAVRHQKLHIASLRTLDLLRCGASNEMVQCTLGLLLSSVKQHFEEEEQTMETYGYDGISEHKASHESLLQEIEGIIGGDKAEDMEKTLEFFNRWLVEHHGGKDAELSTHLKERRVY